MAHNFPKHEGQTKTGARYDARHQRARKAAAAKHLDTDPCTRCRQPLGPMGRRLHYDHTDDGTGYLGFAHASCNVRAGSDAGNAAQRAPHPPAIRRTRQW